MAITFANVTGIKTNNGAYDIERITETNSGKILWEKKNNDYYFMYVNPAYASAFTSGGLRYNNNGGYMSISVPNLPSIPSLPVRSWMAYNNGWKLVAKDVASSGCTFMACYITKTSEETNIPSTALKLTDAKWLTSSFYLIPLTFAQTTAFRGGTTVYSFNDGTGGKSQAISFSFNNSPIQFSAKSGSSIYIKTISSLDNCKTLYEKYSKDSRYWNKTKCPYLGGWFSLHYSSETLKNKYNLPNTSTNGIPNYAPSLTIYFIIKR